MNFRSRAQVLDFCNDIFYKIMSPDLGRVAYDRDAALYYGAKNYDENAKGFKPELLLLDEKDELLSETKNLTKGQMEAHMIATRIADMKQHMQVTDKESGQLRPLRYSDIVILLRSLKDYGTDFVQVLQGAGIPAYVESSTGYFSASEVQTVLAMLRILDNPYQDIPMAAVLRSPLVGLDEEEMAQIRVENPECSFAEAAMHAMQDATEGALYDFYRMYRKLRGKQDLPIHELIQKILQLSGYGNYAAALPAGERRAANLAMLVEKAVDYEKTSYRGLFHFLRYIDKLQKYEVDFGEAHGVSGTCNGYVYSIGGAILDIDNPSIVKYRCENFLLTPEEWYEERGFVPNVCFPCATIHDSASGKIAIYYGAADSYVGLAFTKLDEIVDYIKTNSVVTSADTEIGRR